MPPKHEIFEGEGIDIIFKMLQAIYEGREVSLIDKDQSQVEKWVFNGAWCVVGLVCGRVRHVQGCGQITPHTNSRKFWREFT